MRGPFQVTISEPWHVLCIDWGTEMAYRVRDTEPMMLRFRVEVQERNGATYLESAFADRGRAVARASRLARPYRSIKVTDLAENRLIESFNAIWDRRLPPSAGRYN